MTLGVLAPYRRYGIGIQYDVVHEVDCRHKITGSCPFGGGNSDACDACFAGQVTLFTRPDDESGSGRLVHETRVYDREDCGGVLSQH